MEAKELRIGNLVTDEFYDSFKIVIEVKSINNEGINLIVENDGEYPEMASYWIEPEYTFDKLRPIPLTEEWLLKFGFEKDSVNDYNLCVTIHGNIFLTAFSDDYKTVYLYQNYEMATDYAAKVKYVHQLQNLYFALTGEELTIKTN